MGNGGGDPGRRLNKLREVRKIRVHFMWLYAFSGSFYPYQSLYLEGKGFGKAEIGLILGFTQLVGSLSIIAMGKIADGSENKHKLLLILLLTGAIVCSFSGWLAAGATVAVLALLAILRDPLFPLSDCIAMEMIPSHYGTARIGAPIGYAVAVTTAGFLFQGLSMTLFFPLQALICFLAWQSARGISYLPSQVEQEKKSDRGWLFKNRSLNIFFSYAAICYASIGFYSSYYSLLLRELGFGQGMVGISYQIAVLAELPFLLWAGYFTRKFKLRDLIWLSGLLLGIRWLLLGSRIPAVVFTSQLLHGVTYIVLYYATVLWLDSIAGPLNKASAQGFHALLSSGSKIVGTSLGGWFAELWGVGRVFFWLGILVLVATIIWRLLERLLVETKKTHLSCGS